MERIKISNALSLLVGWPSLQLYSLPIFAGFLFLVIGTGAGDESIADHHSKSAGDNLSDGHYEVMEYGPVIAETIKMTRPEESLVRKGLAIRLDHQLAMIFDRDLVHMAVGSAEGWIDISKTDYTSYKGSDIAQIEGRQVFESSDAAGWARNGEFLGPREDGLGSLPKDWVHYRGYYKHGDEVVLAYRVGETEVLELPQAYKTGGITAFSRHLNIAPSGEELQALLFEQRDGWSVHRRSDHQFIIEKGEGAIGVRVISDQTGVRLVEDENRMTVQIPALADDRLVTVRIFELESVKTPIPNEMGRTDVTSENLLALTQGGPAQWSETLSSPGIRRESGGAYVTDRIPVPEDNPWGSWMRLSSIDFFEDGERAAVTTWNGDVWIVSGIDDSLENIQWRRFASGLFYPMGVAVVDEVVYVTERSQLTRLHDLNGDGEADFYESFNHEGITWPMAHTLGLEVDSDGWFYFFKNGNRVPADLPGHGSLIRVSPDGQSREIFAQGYRGANALGLGSVDAEDQILAVDQEGNWVPVERIDVMRKGGFYGDRRHGGEDLQVGDFDPPVTWVPYHLNNSSGSITYTSDSRWGPLAGNWVLGSYGQSKLYVVLMEEMGGRLQGGVIELSTDSRAGILRGKVNPKDGQLYVVGLRGWTTLASEDGSLERIRYTGEPVYLPVGLHVSPDGVELEFSEPLNEEIVTDPSRYEIQRWEYIYSDRYGSPEVSFERPGETGRDTLHAAGAALSEDGRILFLEIPDMQSVMQMKVAAEWVFEDGSRSESGVYHTVNWLSEEEASNRPEWQERIIAGHINGMYEVEPTETVSSSLDESDVSPFGEGEEPEWFSKGMAAFQTHCMSCHIGGVAPEMSESKWAAGSYEAFIRILLQGKRGQIGVMTPFSWMSDTELADITNYIRYQWHQKEPIEASEVGAIRRFTNDRSELWTDEELEIYTE